MGVEITVSLIEVIQVIEAIDDFELAEDRRGAKTRIAGYLKELGITFFSDYDMWQYHGLWDGKTCVECKGHLRMGQIGGSIYIGSKIRLLFPYLFIVNANTIQANVHPNCRCYLERIT